MKVLLVLCIQVFSFFSLGVFGVDVYLRFLAWRHSSEGPYFSSMTSSLGGVTSSGSDPGPQYWPTSVITHHYGTIIQQPYDLKPQI